MDIKKLMLIGLPIMLLGCPPDDKDDTDDTDVEDTGPATDTDTDPPTADVGFMVELTDNPDQIVVTITNGTEPYSFGYAQTEVIANGGDGWTGEDCYLGEPGTSFQFCHGVGMTGATLSHVDTPGEVVEGSTTLLSVDTPASATPELTYIITGETSGTCWVWGHDINYFDGANCEEYIPMM